MNDSTLFHSSRVGLYIILSIVGSVSKSKSAGGHPFAPVIATLSPRDSSNKPACSSASNFNLKRRNALTGGPDGALSLK